MFKVFRLDKIVFEVGDYLESGYVKLKGEEVDISGSYLEIIEPEEDYTPTYFFATPPVEEETTGEPEQTSEELRSKSETPVFWLCNRSRLLPT